MTSNTNMYGNWNETTVAKEILSKKYYHEGEDFEAFLTRVSSIFSTEELREDVKKALINADFFPGGRSLYGAGSKGKFKSSMSNCYILPKVGDSLEEIFDVSKKMARIFSYGGGCGISISNLRPRGSRVNNSARTSTGACSFMSILDSVGGVIGARGRRAALIIGLDCTHPDLEEFLDAKRNDDKIQSANLSILYTNEFMEAVKNDGEFVLRYDLPASDPHPAETITKKIKARDFFVRFCEAQHSWAEPASLYIDRIRAHNLLAGYPESMYRIDICNPCAEFMGNSYNSCNLGSINLYNIVDKPFTNEAKINWEKLEQLTRLGITTLDEILDYGYDMQPLQENKDCLEDWRSIGLGIFGLADMFVALNLKYGSPSSRAVVSSVMEAIMHCSLATSNELAKSKGTFKNYRWEYIKESPFLKSLEGTRLYEEIKEHGLRNGSLLSIAPTGTLATMCGMSGGAEAHFAIAYQRTTHANSEKKIFFNVLAKAADHLARFTGNEKMLDMEVTELNKALISKFPVLIPSHEVAPSDRILMQAAMQEHVDNAISSTVNMKEETTVEDIFNTYMLAWEKGCKGITIFRDGCARTSILTTANPTDKDGGEVVFDSIVPVKSKDIGDDVIGRKVTQRTACVPEMTNHVYTKDGNVVEIFTDVAVGCTANINTITRLASLALRSGVKVEEVLKQMRKENCSACMDRRKQGDKGVAKSCGNSIANAIEKVYKDINGEGSLQKKDNGMIKCPECGEKTLISTGKCFTCTNCTYNKCD